MWDIVLFLDVLLLELKSLTIKLSCYREDEWVFKRSAVAQFMTRLSGVKSLVVVTK